MIVARGGITPKCLSISIVSFGNAVIAKESANQKARNISVIVCLRSLLSRYFFAFSNIFIGCNIKVITTFYF